MQCTLGRATKYEISKFALVYIVNASTIKCTYTVIYLFLLCALQKLCTGISERMHIRLYCLGIRNKNNYIIVHK